MPKPGSRSYFVGHLWRMLRRGPATIAFPEEEAIISPHYQGVVVADMSLCRGCRLCITACPADALELLGSRETGFRMRVYHDRCAVCGLCELACISGVIQRQPAYVSGATSRDSLCDEYREATEADQAGRVED
jgi:formate hydrogenlyase subunit 6/NADH:ubiquinone oxidoreductase subunit I